MFQITTDNTADLPVEYLQEHNIGCIPISYILDGVTYGGEKELDWNDRLKIKKGSHGINIEFSVPKRDEKGDEVKDPATGKTVNEKITAKLFNIAQVENSEKLVEWAKEQAQKRYEYKKAQAGDKWHEANPNKVREVVNATSSEPAQYLAEYFDAMEKGKDFTASKEIVDDFKKKTKDMLTQKQKDILLWFRMCKTF